MPDLAEFLLARIAEDEEAANQAIAGARPDWVVGCEETSDGENAFWAVEALGEKSEWFADLGSQPSDADRAAHIARWDPSRVLAECAAKRAIVELHCTWRQMQVPLRKGVYHWDNVLVSPDRDDDGDGWATLTALAAPYADHPDYDQSWRP